MFEDVRVPLDVLAVQVAHPVEPLPHLDRRGHGEVLHPLEVRGEGGVRVVGYARTEEVDGGDVGLAVGGLQVERVRPEAGEEGEGVWSCRSWVSAWIRTSSR